MQNTEFKGNLVTRGACQDALDWIGAQEPEAAWHGCAAADHFHWLGWLVCRLPSLSPLWAEYDANRRALFYSLFPWGVVEQALLKDPVSSQPVPRTR